MAAQIIKTNGVVVALRDTSLESLQEAVGGYIEVVKRCPDNLVLLADEEGLLKNKPMNKYASELAGSSIVGDAVLCKLSDLE